MRSIDEISQTNPEKPLLLEVDGKEYYRCPIHTHLIQVGENLSDLMRQYVQPYFQEGDVVYISEKIVSLCQRDIIPKDSLKISRMAKFLARFASTNDGAGVGVHNVYKMQVAIMLCGKPKILYAALAAGLGRLQGKRGVFYEIAGPEVAGLDGFYSTYFGDYKNFGILSPKGAGQSGGQGGAGNRHPLLHCRHQRLWRRCAGRVPPSSHGQAPAAKAPER